MNKKLFKTILLLLVLPLLVLAIKTVLDIRKGAAGTPANIVITPELASMRSPASLWQNLAQGGEEAADMVKPVISQVKALSPKLIRVDHLYDYYKVYNGPNNYDFSKLDQVVNSIVATGATPLLSISYTTADMASNNQNAGEPKDWNTWYNLVKATANRYSVQKGIQGIYYEVWNEPDLFGGWHYGKNPNYTTLYIQTAKGVRDGAAGSSFKVGGPATTAYYTNWIKSLIKTSAAYNLPLDFISWHKYSKNMEDFDKDINSLTELLSNYPDYMNIEKIITEIGPNPEPDPWYESSLSGIHLMSLSTRLAGKIHRIFPFEIVDGPTKRSDKTSGWGMITHPNNGAKPKPRYYALQFMNKLTGGRLSSWGDGSWVTALATKNGQNIQALIVNYDSRGVHVETVPVTFQGISPGTYKLNITNFLGGTTSRNSQTMNSMLTERFYMEPNSAMLVELIPLETR